MFWDVINSIGILERNVARVEALEARQIRRLIKMYREALKEVELDLLFAQDNSFTEAKLATTMIKLEQTIKSLKLRLNRELRTSYDIMSEQGPEDAAKEINVFEKKFEGITTPVNVGAIVASIEPKTFLFNQYQSSIESYNQDLRSDFQRVLGQSLLQGKTLSQIIFDMQMVATSSEWKLARIVRTELHQIYNVSKLDGFSAVKEQYYPDLQKALYHPIDGRTGDDSKTANAKNLIVDIDKPFVYTFKRGDKVVKRVFQTPPDRPNDRSILIPYRKSYDKNKD